VTTPASRAPGCPGAPNTGSITHRNCRRAIFSGLPDEDDPTQRNWTQLACDLVDDIRGVETRDYLTFRDGWIYQEVIDVVRAAAGWTRIDGA